MAIDNNCSQCHIKSFCDDCHRIEMPHPKEFLPEHSKIMRKKGKELCYRCHIRDDCEHCHVRHIHPGQLKPAPALEE